MIKDKTTHYHILFLLNPEPLETTQKCKYLGRTCQR